VETLVKQMAIFLSGIAATITGVFIRSCERGVEMTLASAWCGRVLPEAALQGGHGHCTGCAIAFAGLVAMGLAAASPIAARRLKNAGARARR